MSSMSFYDIVKSSENKLKTFQDYLAMKTIREKEPLSVLIELSPVCNFDCEMCYIRTTMPALKESGKNILRFDEWKKYIDDLCELGFSSFTLTGGECTLHPDFIRIYQYLYDKRRQITVMTNGSCLDEDLFQLFIKNPPWRIYLTIYGMSRETYQTFCKNGDAFERVINNVKRIKEIGIPLILQYTCGKDNLCDLEEAYYFAKEQGLNMPFVSDLIQFNNCSSDKIENVKSDEQEFKKVSTRIYCDMFGITEEEYEEKVFSEQISEPSETIIKKGMRCNAGRNSCVINWEGELRPCNVMDAFSVKPYENGGMKQCWEDLKKWADEVPAIVECQKCIFKKKCRMCSAMHYNDTHKFGVPSPRLCFKKQHPEEASILEERFYQRKKNEG